MNFSKHLTSVIIIIIAVLSFGGGIFVGTTQKQAQDLADQITSGLDGTALGGSAVVPQDLNFKLFWEVWQKVKLDAVDHNVTDQDLFYGAVRGVVGALKDPYSVFFTPDETKKFNEELSGSFEGIGAEIGFNKNNILSIIAPLPGTPAERAGLKAEDMILKIDGQDTVNINLDEAVGKIRGTKGTNVTLNIFREGFSEPRDFNIIRDKIQIESVKWEMKEAGGKKFAYIKISHFNADTAAKFEKIVMPVLQKNPDGIILDLRNNPGGFLDVSVDIAGFWTGDKTVVIEQIKRDKKEELKGNGIARFQDIPTVVLVNGGSASASEIVAGALQDHGRAKIVGTKTFGKGSVQELESLGNGSSLKLTVAKWLTPKGVSISEKGITPDVEVKFSDKDFEEKKDPQMDKALELLAAGG
ncbi:S41 family peptidase [Patescibacteria group bacterium]|nr:MAG: S41 family peptidase [Patescibacteria group bacterium]